MFRRKHVKTPDPPLRRVASWQDLVEYWRASRGYGAPTGWYEIGVYEALDRVIEEVERQRLL